MEKHFREISDIQNKYLDSYLNKSGDSLEEFLQETGNIEKSEFEGLGWIEYIRYDDILWIHNAYSCKSHKETKEIWKSLLKLAKKKGCKKVHFTTKRNPKAFEKLYGTKVIEIN